MFRPIRPAVRGEKRPQRARETFQPRARISSASGSGREVELIFIKRSEMTAKPTSPPAPPQRQIPIRSVSRAAVEELVATIPHDDPHADINDVVEGMKAAGYAKPIVAAAVAHQKLLSRMYGKP